MRLSEIFEAAPDYSFLRRRLSRRVTELWNNAADRPVEALAEARLLYSWLRDQAGAGQVAQIRQDELIHFLQS